MSIYEALLFLHVTSVAFWLGAELLVEILVHRAERQGNPTAMRRLFNEFNALDPIFIPATLVVLAAGIAMVIDRAWLFGEPWIVIGLSGFAFIYLYGFGYLQPQVNRLQAMSEGEAATGSEAQALMRRFFVRWRIETTTAAAAASRSSTGGPTRTNSTTRSTSATARRRSRQRRPRRSPPASGTAIMAFERQAWLDAVLRNPNGPDLSRYLEARLEGEI